MRTHYIYKITNQLCGKFYIGQTIDKNRRWKEHQYYALVLTDLETPEKSKSIQYIHRAMAKHGIHNFTFEIIDFAFDPWQADCIEIALIELYQTRNKQFGYNLTRGGNHFEKSEEGLASFIEKVTGDNHWSRKNPEKFQEHLLVFNNNDGIPWNKGIKLDYVGHSTPHTAEAKQKMSDALKGHPPNSTSFKPGCVPYNKGKTHLVGPKNPASKLTLEQVQQIRDMKKANPNISDRIIGDQFGVSYATVNNITHFKVYKGT